MFCACNRPFHRHGGHIELIGFKEYYGMPRGAWARSHILASVSTRAFRGQFFFKFSEKKIVMRKRDRCSVFGCNNDRLFPEKYIQWSSLFARKARVNTERVPPGHPILRISGVQFFFKSTIVLAASFAGKFTIDQPCFQSNIPWNRWYVARTFQIW